ncbi:MAG TPA: type II toxin-antitoxin system RelE/ParE family toxin [bacterium]|nr:type II toxin-antitoxin system RelE/ParE family toxin [bacterium]
MASFKIILKPSVEKDFRTLPKVMVERVFTHIQSLSENPYPPQAIKLENSEGLYRIRVGNYRIVYGVDKAMKLITIHYVRHRKEVCRGL